MDTDNSVGGQERVQGDKWQWGKIQLKKQQLTKVKIFLYSLQNEVRAIDFSYCQDTKVTVKMSDGLAKRQQGWGSQVACVTEGELGRPTGSWGRTARPTGGLRDPETGLSPDLSARPSFKGKLACRALVYEMKRPSHSGRSGSGGLSVGCLAPGSSQVSSQVTAETPKPCQEAEFEKH